MRSALTMPTWRIAGRAGGAAIEATALPGDPFSLSWSGGRRGQDAFDARSSRTSRLAGRAIARVVATQLAAAKPVGTV